VDSAEGYARTPFAGCKVFLFSEVTVAVLAQSQILLRNFCKNVIIAQFCANKLKESRKVQILRRKTSTAFALFLMFAMSFSSKGARQKR
jgi:hypothetical protein